MSNVNPYAYTEEPDFVFSKQHAGRAGEPALPLNMPLFHQTSVFLARPCQMAVTEDQIEISGMHLDEPVTVQRLAARDQVKLRLLGMKIRDDNGRKYRLKYLKSDPEKYLTLARLEAWLDPDLTDDPEAAQQRVDHRLKIWTCCMVTNWMTGLLVIQGFVLMAAITIVAALAFDNGRDWIYENMAYTIVMLCFVALVTAPNVVFLILIQFGRIGILSFVIGFYSFFGLIALITFSPIAALIAGLLIYYSVKARSDYKRLSLQVGGIMV